MLIADLVVLKNLKLTIKRPQRINNPLKKWLKPYPQTITNMPNISVFEAWHFTIEKLIGKSFEGQDFCFVTLSYSCRIAGKMSQLDMPDALMSNNAFLIRSKFKVEELQVKCFNLVCLFHEEDPFHLIRWELWNCR